MSFRQFKNPYQEELANIEEQNRNLTKNEKLAEFIKQNYVMEKWPSIDEADIFTNDKAVNCAFVDEEKNQLNIFSTCYVEEDFANSFSINIYLNNLRDSLLDFRRQYFTKDPEFSAMLNEFVVNNNHEDKVNVYLILLAKIENNTDYKNLLNRKEQEIIDVINYNKRTKINVNLKVWSIEQLENELDLLHKKAGSNKNNSLEVLQANQTADGSVLEVKNGKNKVLLTVLKADGLRDIYQKASDEQRASFFDLNVREYINANKNVDNQIIDTLKNNKDKFFIFNNGITIVGKNISRNGYTINLDEMNIVNGAQTFSIIGSKTENIDLTGVGVFAKIIELNDYENDDLTMKISIASNSQKPISPKDLLSQYKEVEDFEKSFNALALRYDSRYYFQRKRSAELNRSIRHDRTKIPLSIDKFIKTSLWALFSKPGTSRSGSGKFISEDQRDEFATIKRTFIYSKPSNQDLEVLLFLEDVLFLQEKIKQYKSNIYASKIFSSEVIDFYKNGNLYIASLMVDLLKTFRFQEYLRFIDLNPENNSLRSENAIFSDENKKELIIQRLFERVENDSLKNYTKVYQEKINSFLKKHLDGITKNVKTFRDKKATFTNTTKKDKTYFKLLEYYANPENELEMKEDLKQTFSLN
ncbi:hypothetical protein LD125_00475 [Mesoplasma sp. JKS002658]|uniref:AIPR family protein n=1 Tax=Mesoplasma whartonense TaxID=2878854 RepID=UPI002022B5AF|nr:MULTISPECIES: AIPR family protein [unclassified Mesoplasma]MCL8211407.1 hypothetical protein [Mesoplasma sp. JKS002664]MCL8212259.1 hypothetical protein [Mesoplasma sp. JKS002662]MCL8214212.1 hypothetical protein [Mesoplasma sp. JKS002658]MCL8214744.1 hypothetical protein [Mesoplasma sp. JKS002663]MCL8215531.1 hypothetical protein [Mesoplasma sp. JKS002659]